MKGEFIKIIEGCFYEFTLEGELVLPSGDKYFKLSDPNGYKHLLNADEYRFYNLTKGQKINCRVDHINCTGKIFIEPEHPIYKPGQLYKFQVLGYDTIINKLGEQEKIVILKDHFGNKIKTSFDWSEKDLDELEARVIRIKKGQIYVDAEPQASCFDEIIKNAYHSFRISGLRTLSQKYEYYILKDDLDRTYHLRTKYYQKYFLKPGQLVRCRMIRGESGFYFEPDHPFYTIGETYAFTIVCRTSIQKYPEKETPALELQNDYGKNILLPLAILGNHDAQKETIECRVDDIYRGSLILSHKKSPFELKGLMLSL